MLKDDMLGYWYGFEGSHQPGGFDREHTILQVRVNEIQEFESSSENGRTAAKGVLFRGIGEGMQTRLFLVGEVFEVRCGFVAFVFQWCLIVTCLLAESLG